MPTCDQLIVTANAGAGMSKIAAQMNSKAASFRAIGDPSAEFVNAGKAAIALCQPLPQKNHAEATGERQ